MTCKRAFTMVEIMVVVVIIAIVAMVASNQYRSFSAQSKWAAVQSCLTDAANRLENYRSNRGKYPEDDIWAAINSSGACSDNYEGQITVFEDGTRYVISFCDRKAPVWSSEKNDVWVVIDTRPATIHLRNSLDSKSESIDSDYMEQIHSDCAPTW